jgi:hypothetical protein
MDAPPGRLARCAVYTRKSTEYNLELAFNSLDAQPRFRGYKGGPAPVRVKLKRAERLPRPARRKHRYVTVLPRMAGAPAQQEINEPTGK